MQHLDLQLARELLTGQLPPDDQTRWMAHVDTCQRCRDLLTSERALLTVLHLDEPPLPITSPDVDRVVERVSDELGAARTRRRRRWLLAGGEALAVCALAILLIWQVVTLPSEAEQLAAELRISPELQSRVVQQMDELRTLRADPWLVTDYEAVAALHEMIAARQADKR